MYAFLIRLSGDEELVRERMCCAIALSLSFILSQNMEIRVPVWRRDARARTHTCSKHENTKLPFKQTKKKTKWPLMFHTSW